MQNGIAQHGVVWTLLALDGDARIRIGQHTMVGRDSACQLHLTESEIGSEHAELTIESDGLWLTDLNSESGTFLNGIRIVGSVNLVSGDEISFGKVGFEVRSGNSIMTLNQPIPLRVSPIRSLPESEPTENLQLSFFPAPVEKPSDTEDVRVSSTTKVGKREWIWIALAVSFGLLAVFEFLIARQVILDRASNLAQSVW